MFDLDDVVAKIIANFTNANTLFTALDISNEVKKNFPFVRHREVRDSVRKQLTDQDLVVLGYSKTPIDVTLKDGQQVIAMLYHNTMDSWDLDTKYSDQQRSQLPVSPSPALPITIPAIVSAGSSAPSSYSLIAAPMQPRVQTAAATATTTTINDKDVKMDPVEARQRWKNLFDAVPSLFPRQH